MALVPHGCRLHSSVNEQPVPGSPVKPITDKRFKAKAFVFSKRMDRKYIILNIYKFPEFEEKRGAEIMDCKRYCPQKVLSFGSLQTLGVKMKINLVVLINIIKLFLQ